MRDLEVGGLGEKLGLLGLELQGLGSRDLLRAHGSWALGLLVFVVVAPGLGTFGAYASGNSLSACTACYHKNANLPLSLSCFWHGHLFERCGCTAASSQVLVYS